MAQETRFQMEEDANFLPNVRGMGGCNGTKYNFSMIFTTQYVNWHIPHSSLTVLYHILHIWFPTTQSI